MKWLKWCAIKFEGRGWVSSKIKLSVAGNAVSAFMIACRIIRKCHKILPLLLHPDWHSIYNLWPQSQKQDTVKLGDSEQLYSGSPSVSELFYNDQIANWVHKSNNR